MSLTSSGALMYGPPGTGKTLLARACAAQTDATFLKLAGPQLVQMFIGDGAKLVRDCFALAKEKAPSIIFIDELDAVGTKRFDSEKSGDREVQRTMLELLNQLDGFASDDRVKVLAATNRVDVLDPALLRSGRLDRKIEFPLPNEEARAQILRIHSRKMTVDEGVNWQELARSTDEFGGAQLKAVCVEAGMIALRSGQHKISHEHYVDAIAEVQVRLDLPITVTLNPTDTVAGQEEGHCQLLRIERRWLDKAGWSHGALLGRACSLVRASHDRTIMIRTQCLHCCVSFIPLIKK
jgi:26S proteasome regulatory subunit T5